MPSPVLHSFAGYSIYKMSLKENDPKSWKAAGFFMLLANLPDLDTIPGMFFGNPGLFHRGFAHSLTAALLCAALTGAVARVWKKISFSRVFLFALAAYCSHILMDALTGYVSFVFWPFRISFQPLLFGTSFCALLTSSSLALRLSVEALLVFFISRLARFFPKYRVLHTGVSDSPAFIAGFAILLFVLTALVITEVAG